MARGRALRHVDRPIFGSSRLQDFLDLTSATPPSKDTNSMQGRLKKAANDSSECQNSTGIVQQSPSSEEFSSRGYLRTVSDDGSSSFLCGRDNAFP